MERMLKSDGRVDVLGLSANKSAQDWIISGALLLPISLTSKLHRESSYPDMTTARPGESLTEIRRAAAAILPRSRARRRFYYRYTLTWTKPAPTA